MKEFSPVHWSPKHGVHVDEYDLNTDQKVAHIPFEGQTTIQTFVSPSYENDQKLAVLGGTLDNIDITKLW